MDTVKRLWKILKSQIPRDSEETPYEPDSSDDGYQANDHQPQSRTDLKEHEYYKNLETPVGADFQTIKSNYRKLLKKYHPDRYNQDDDKRQIAEEVTEKLNQAYRYFKKKHQSGGD